MSRSGYSDDYDSEWSLICWRGQVASAIRGKRGQAFLRELLDALEAMPDKRLIADDFRRDGEVCALGAVAVKRGRPDIGQDPEDYDGIATDLGIAPQLVQEIEFVNDELDDYYRKATPEQRWQKVHDWAESQIWDWTWE